jgi:hypothetical protein
MMGGVVLGLLATTGSLGCSSAEPTSPTGQARQAVVRGKVASLDRSARQMVVRTPGGTVLVGWQTTGANATIFTSGSAPASSDDLQAEQEVEVEGELDHCDLSADSVDVSPGGSGSGGASSGDSGGLEPEDGCAPPAGQGGSGGAEQGDDSGSGGAEQGDDSGSGGAEQGDDNCSGGAEQGDDSGGS